jgi:SRSO17 transposase
VIARRNVRRPDEISFYFVYCRADTALYEPIRVAGARWAVDGCLQTTKQERGPDDYHVRRHPGWHRHVTLAMAAHACLTIGRVLEVDAGKAETDPPVSSRSARPSSDV